jgi:adenylosuccinate lyase
MDRTKYENPLVSRYASDAMSLIWSPQFKFSTWRRLWLALAKAEQGLGLDITDEQIAEMEANLDDIDFDRAAEIERVRRHDVMSHVETFGERCPAAKPIIHLGATSCFVTDNTELIQMRESLSLLRGKMLSLMSAMAEQAHGLRALPTLGFTHYQPAQLTTVGKRICLWLQDFLFDFQELDRQLASFPFRGVKGTTGTQASFLKLFDDDHEKVNSLNARVTELMGFSSAIPVSGQTYTRKIDTMVLNTLAGIASSAYKMAGDIRLLMNLKEVDEPFAKKQIGSSAMAYKRNPMRSERICSLARYVMSLPANGAATHSNQWFERTLDDSAIRRIVLPEAFLATDVILSISSNVMQGLRVWPEMIRRRIDEELPYMATENIMMACVKAGGDRQDMHEAVRIHSVAASERVKDEGVSSDLMDRIAADPCFAPVHGELDSLLDPAAYVGRAPEQVDEFLDAHIRPLLDANKDAIAADQITLRV